MPKFDVDPSLVRKLAELLSDTGLMEIEYAEGERRIRLSRGSAAAPAATAAAPPHATAVPAPAPAPQPAAPAGPPAGAVTSPMVGTAYLSPEPGTPAFVKVGDRVTEGQTLLIVEAMKVMNPIRSPRTGTITSILITDAQPIEFGEVLMVIE